MNGSTKPRRQPGRWRGVGVLLMLIVGAVCAAWLGRQAGGYFGLQPGEMRPIAGPHLHLSGPT